MLIRHADPSFDAAPCAAIYAPFVTDSVISLEEQPPDERELARRIERVSRTHPWLVAMRSDAVAGYAYASAHHERAGYRWAADVAVYVGDGHRRCGVGRALYGELLALLVRQGVRVACAGITLPNEASQALHEGFGFRPVGVYERIAWKMGAWRDVGWWQAELVPRTDGKPPDPGPPAHLG